MMKWVDFAVFKLVVFLIIGIIFGRQEWLSLSVSRVLGLACLVLLIVSWLIANRQIFQKIYFGILVYVGFFLAGNILFQLHQPFRHSNHYIHKTDFVENSFIQLNIRSVLKSDVFSQKYIAEITALNGEKTSGKILVNISKDNSSTALNVDDILLVNTAFEEIFTPKNPYGFDYAEFMSEQGIYRQIHLRKESILVTSQGRTTLEGIAHRFRQKLTQKLHENNFSQETSAIINALLLGQKQDVSSETYQNYAAAGVIHILTVSGLHVGILMLILQFLFKPLDTHFKKGKNIKMVIIIVLLWIFGLIAGFSPSVTRSVTMFSFLMVALHLKRPTSTFNSLASSALVLLVLNPNTLFNIGFQLSYLAVWGILAFNSVFQKVYRPRTFIDKSVWGNLTVSLSAQIGVLPLTLYYFHQFPGLFLLANLIIIPFTGVLLGGGVLVLALAMVDALPAWLAVGYQQIIVCLNQLVAWIARQESFVFENIPFSFAQMILGYFIIIGLFLFLEKRSFKNLVVTLLAIIIFQGNTFYEKYQKQSVSQLVVFHKSRNTLIGIKTGENLNLYSNMNEDAITKLRFYKDYLTREHIGNTHFHSFVPNVLDFENERIWIIDSLALNIPGKKPDVVILSHSPKINLERITESFSPALIIADGSNYKSYVEKWKETCIKKKLPFHHTAEKGAFIILSK